MMKMAAASIYRAWCTSQTMSIWSSLEPCEADNTIPILQMKKLKIIRIK